jgi:hypothetical protein
MGSAIWHLASGIWYLASGIWHLWHLASGIWQMACGIRYLHQDAWYGILRAPAGVLLETIGTDLSMRVR